MNNEIKLAKFYSPAKMQRAVMLMEQFWLLANDPDMSEDDKKCAKALYAHYRRLAMCILSKEFPTEMKTDLIIDKEYMQNIYKKYTI